MPRYFKGRPILVKAHVNTLIESEEYSSYDEKVGERFVTHNAILVGREGNHFLIDVKNSPNLIKVPLKETLELNQPHIFQHDVRDCIILEDSLVFNPKGHAEKAKLMEMAFKLAPIIETLDFTKEDAIEHQIKAIHVIRNCLDFIANNVGNEKIMHPDRPTTGEVGKISLHGQGSCHGCSSVVGSYLYHFAPLLGLDVKYRSGFSFHDVPGEHIHATMDKH